MEWTIVPRGDVAAHWSGLYVTMNKIGSLTLSRITHERLGSPEAVTIRFNRFTEQLSLTTAKLDDDHAYPLKKYGQRGAKIVRVFRLVSQFGIRPPDTDRVSGTEDRSRGPPYIESACNSDLAEGTLSMP
ncbi:MAG: hypothetical protein QM785_13060 [Pyrinomonadaceae bacterium]